MAYRAIHAYPPLGASFAESVKQTAGQFKPANTVPGLPPSIAAAPKNLPSFNPRDYDATKFAADQAKRWASAEMQKDIAYGRQKLSEALHIPLPNLPGMSATEIGSWTAGYLAAHGTPKNLEDGARMGTAFVHAEAEALGVQPEWIAAADFVMHTPKSADEAFALGVQLGKSYFMKYGVPLLQQELMSVSSNLAMVTQGIPVQFAVAGYDALKDGKLTKEEIAGIAVQVASYACGLLLQAIGIPAPLGALIGAVIAQGLTVVADDVIHSEDSDQRSRKAAIAALEKQRNALMSQCAQAIPEVWDKTQDYWEKVLAPIQALMDRPEVQSRLIIAGGLRYYGRNTVTLPAGVTLPSGLILPVGWREQWQSAGMAAAVADAEVAAKTAEARAASLPKAAKDSSGIRNAAVSARIKANALKAKAAADAKKPLYSYGFDCLWWEGNLVFDYDAGSTAKGYERPSHLRNWLPASAKPYPDGCLYYTRMMPTRMYEGFADPSKWAVVPFWPNPASIVTRCAVVSGHRDPPTFHAESQAICAPFIKAQSQAASSGPAPDLRVDYDQQDMLVRVTPYSDHKSDVVMKTVKVKQGAMVDGKPNAQAALMFWGATRPAAVDSAYLPAMKSGTSDEARWKAYAYIDPSQIRVSGSGKKDTGLDLAVDYCDVSQWYEAVQVAAAASALVQQDIIRTVAWQVGAEEAARVKLAASQAGAAATVARLAAKATLQAKALSMARASTGAYSAALKARLRFQAAKASAALQRKVLIGAGVAGVAVVGAFLIWKVASKRRAR